MKRMRRTLLLALLLCAPALADYELVPNSEPYFCDVNPDGFFLATETYPTKPLAEARAPAMVEEYEVDVEVICTETDRYNYVSGPVVPPPVVPPDFSDCFLRQDGSGIYECQYNRADGTYDGYTETDLGTGWWIYTPIVGPVPPVPPPPPPPPGPVPSGAWIGVPQPSFGVSESVSDSQYTHWVDNSVNCSDAGNGTPTNPRCTIPNTFEAGSIVQLRGGPYSEMVVTFNGTASNPIFFRGATGTKVSLPGRNGLDVSGSYFIIENIDANRVKAGTPSFGAFRDSYFHDVNTGGLIGIGGNDLVFLRVEVARNGLIPSAKDRHGFNIGTAFNIWILDSLIHTNSGDAIQFCHGCVAAGNGGPGPIYIANNVMHSDEENAIDMKEFTGPIIFSGNELYNYYPLGFSGSGDALRVNDEGNQGELWVIRNNIHDSNICMNAQGSDAESYAVDNTCTNTNFNANPGFTQKAGNIIEGVNDGIDPEPLYALFESRHGISIRQ